jgi:hypothetical protein
MELKQQFYDFCAEILQIQAELFAACFMLVSCF